MIRNTQIASRSLLLVILALTPAPSPLLAKMSQPGISRSPQRQVGSPFIRNFNHKEYKAHAQNWAIVQDKRGILYFGNTDGLVIFDGVYWRLLQLPNKSPVSGLAIDRRGRVFVGGRNEIGYLAADSSGQLEYISLMDLLPPDEREFGNIWTAAANDNDLYFRAGKRVFLWRSSRSTEKTKDSREGEGPDTGSFTIFRTSSKFSHVSVVNGEVYVHEKNRGLLRMQDDSLQLVPNGDLFANKYRPIVLPFERQGSKQTLLVTTYRDGLFAYDGQQFERLPTDVDSFLTGGSILYHAAVLEDRTIVLATLEDGIFQIDESGKLVRVLNKSSGLRDQHINFVFSDREAGLWLAMNEGLACVEMPSPFTFFDESHGLPSTIYRVIRHEARIYVATTKGVYRLDDSDSQPLAFKKIQGLDGQAWYLASARGSLLAATRQGVFAIRDNRTNRIAKGISYSLYPSQRDSNLVYVGLIDGLAVLQWGGGRWRWAGKLPEIAAEVRSMTEDKNGDLWLGTRASGVIRVSLADEAGTEGSEMPHVEIAGFGADQGLPPGGAYVSRINRDASIATSNGLRYFDSKTQSFCPDSTFGGHLADSSAQIDRVVQDARGGVWLLKESANGAAVGVARRAGDGSSSHEWFTQPFRRLQDWSNQVYQIYPDQGDLVWFAVGDALIRYDPAVDRNVTRPFDAMVRRVTIDVDSLIYGGHPGRFGKPASLNFGNHVLRFEYATASFDYLPANRFQVMLEGFDEDWSNWSSETQKDYTGLPEGDYRFRVRARNVYGTISREDSIAFSISPPWFRTGWAYSAYFVLIVGLVWGLRQGRVAHLEKRTRKLDSMVALRTMEVRDQAEKLQEMDATKSRFFANISHEFRTPLTLILGPAEDLFSMAADAKSKHKLSLIHRNASLLLQLINQLLDLSKLEAGKVQLQVSPGDFVAFLKGLTMSFESWAREKRIDLRFDLDLSPKPLNPTYFDHDNVEKIFSNLISNAIKFTPEGGSVKVTVALLAECRWGNEDLGWREEYEIRHPRCKVCSNRRRSESSQGPSSPVNCAEIAIQDTGEGIPADRLPQIFDRFYQVDASSRRLYGGAGIGLALVKELVELHNGSIMVQSDKGRGAAFTVCLPLGVEHLKPEEIVESAAPRNLPPKSHSNGDFADSLSDSDILVSAENGGQPAAVDDTIVLIIDDNADVRAYIRGHLEGDYRIIEAGDGEEGVAKAVEAIPDLVVSDVMMPGKDGFQVCQALKTDERTSHIPVILLTAKAAGEEKIAGLETGADAYLLKPFRPRELAVRVRKLIELRLKLRERFSAATVIKPSEIIATSRDKEFLQLVVSAADDHLGDEHFGLEDLAAAVSMSASQLHRKLRALINQSPGQFLRTMRLQRAADLLKQNAGTVAEISYQVGFGSQAHFTKMFQKQFGCTPGEFKRGECGLY